MLQEEEPWDTCPPFPKLRPPPKVSQCDISSTRLMRDCVYPQLPPLYIRGPPDATFDPSEPAAEAMGLGLLEEAAGLVVPTQPSAQFGELSDPLSLDVSSQPEGGCQSLTVGAQHQLPLPPSPLSTWTLGTNESLTSRAERTQLGTSFHISPPSPLPSSPSSSTRPLTQPFDSTLSCLQPNLQAQVRPGNISPHPSTNSLVYPPRLHGVKVESTGKRPELISKREARGITQMVNQACKEPLGSLNNTELLASLSTRPSDGSLSRDAFGESLGLALTFPPASASGQGSLSSRLQSIQTNRLLQDDLLRQMSPSHRAAASCMVRIDISQYLLWNWICGSPFRAQFVLGEFIGVCRKCCLQTHHLDVTGEVTTPLCSPQTKMHLLRKLRSTCRYLYCMCCIWCLYVIFTVFKINNNISARLLIIPQYSILIFVIVSSLSWWLKTFHHFSSWAHSLFSTHHL